MQTRRPRGVRPLPLHPELWKTATYAILCLRVQVGQESRPCCGDRTVAVAIAQKRQPPARSQPWVSGMVHPVWGKKKNSIPRPHFLCSQSQRSQKRTLSANFLELGSFQRSTVSARGVWNDISLFEPQSVQRLTQQLTQQQPRSTWGFIRGESTCLCVPLFARRL